MGAYCCALKSTPVGLQNGTFLGLSGCKSMRNLVGLPGFEPGTSCTPSKRASQAAPQPEDISVHGDGGCALNTGHTPQLCVCTAPSDSLASSRTNLYPIRVSVVINVGRGPGGSIFFRSWFMKTRRYSI